jgi:hypothetical protein
MLSVVAPDSPVIAKLTASNVRIQLLKRICLQGTASRVSLRHVLVATGEVQQIREYSHGVTLLRGVIQAGLAGRERSWQIKGVAEVQASNSSQYYQISKANPRLTVCRTGPASTAWQYRQPYTQFPARRSSGSDHRPLGKSRERTFLNGRPSPPALGLARGAHMRDHFN